MRSDHLTLDSGAFGVAAGTVTAALFTLCALAVAAAPEATAAAFSYMLHLDLTGIARPITWGGFAGGLICMSLGVAITFWAVAALYNRLSHDAPVPIRDELAAGRLA